MKTNISRVTALGVLFVTALGFSGTALADPIDEIRCSMQYGLTSPNFYLDLLMAGRVTGQLQTREHAFGLLNAFYATPENSEDSTAWFAALSTANPMSRSAIKSFLWMARKDGKCMAAFIDLTFKLPLPGTQPRHRGPVDHGRTA